MSVLYFIRQSFADTEDTSYEWCMNIAGDSMKIEFKQVIELFGIKLLFSVEKFSRNVLQGFFRAYIKWSLDKVTWIVVNPEVTKLTIFIASLNLWWKVLTV